MLRRGLKRALATTLCASMILSTGVYAEAVNGESEILETQLETEESEVVETQTETEESEVVETQTETEETEVLETQPETEETKSETSEVPDIANLAQESVMINAANFPDAVFRAYVNSAAIDKNVDGVLSVEEINAVERIDVSWKGNVKSLKGIEYFNNLLRLNCSGNQVTTLDVSKNTKLEDISCTYNALEELKLGKHPNLLYIHCSDNQITQLDVSGCPNLKVLSCENNDIKSLDLLKHEALENVDCANNGLEELKLGNHPDLYWIECDRNPDNTAEYKRMSWD